MTVITILIGQQQYSYLYSYGLIALAITRAITGHTHTNKSTDYCPNRVINYSIMITVTMPYYSEVCD